MSGVCAKGKRNALVHGDLFSESGPGVGREDGLAGTASGLKSNWDCSQSEDDFEEGEVMD